MTVHIRNYEKPGVPPLCGARSREVVEGTDGTVTCEKCKREYEINQQVMKEKIRRWKDGER